MSAEDDVRRWVEAVVVGLDLCPFALSPHRLGRIRYTTAPAAEERALLQALIEEVIRLDEWAPTEVSTTLVLLPAVTDFDAMLDLTAAAEAVIEQLGLGASFQLVAFHPDYVFEGAELDDPANHVNRAPHPLVHILRADEVAAAIAAHPDIASIPADNAARLRALGVAALRALW